MEMIAKWEEMSIGLAGMFPAQEPLKKRSSKISHLSVGGDIGAGQNLLPRRSIEGNEVRSAGVGAVSALNP